MRGFYLSSFAVLLLALHLACGVRVRYTHLNAMFVGVFGPDYTVANLHDCTIKAYNNKMVGYRIRMEGDKMTCSLLRSFSKFKSLYGSEVRDYILTTNLEGHHCLMVRNVTVLLSKPCDPKTGDCN
uniref:ZP domain-containing protein n=1 Tax=Steinernema glaseri TaxID=37863 RepID=A0A1I8AEG4_9BILA